MYEIQNPETNHVFLKTNDLKLAKRYFNNISRRKHCNIHIVDTETYEIIKRKKPIVPQNVRTIYQNI